MDIRFRQCDQRIDLGVPYFGSIAIVLSCSEEMVMG